MLALYGVSAGCKEQGADQKVFDVIKNLGCQVCSSNLMR